MGTPDFSVPALHALIAAGYRVAAAYTRPPRPAGRGKISRPGPVHAAAGAMGIEVRCPVTFNDPADVAAFVALQADVAVVVAYGLILPQAVLDAPRHGCLNIHASLLPRWRGAAPIHRAIMAGDRKTGICIIQMDAGVDTGPVLWREETEILPGDTAGSLHNRLAALGADSIRATLACYRDIDRQPQPVAGVTLATRIDKAEARVDWTRPATDVDRHIRGLSPFPGAWCKIRGGRVKLLLSREAEGTGTPGQILRGTTVACGDGAVELLCLQRAGKRVRDASAFLNGMILKPGEHLG